MAEVTLTDVTDRTWTTLSNPPDGSALPLEASPICRQDSTTCIKDTADRKNDKPHYVRNKDWDPLVLPKMTSPLSWPFLQQPMFTKARSATFDVLNLKTVAEPPAGYTVKIYSVKFAKAADAPPQFIAVAYPKELKRTQPPPFLVHFKHVPGQAQPPPPGQAISPELQHALTLFKYFDPLGYDWLAFEIWNWLVYIAFQDPSLRLIVDMPFLSKLQVSYGFCYQLRNADKQYVIVLPQISRVRESSTGRLRDYQLYSASTLRALLLALQKEIWSINNEYLSHVAISAFSSGCDVLGAFVRQGGAASKNDKASSTFMRDELNEIFVFDPPNPAESDAMVTIMNGWRKLSSTRGPTQGKCIRFYTRHFTKNFGTLTGGTNPFQTDIARLWESQQETTLVYLPFRTDGADIWARTLDEIRPGSFLPVSTRDFVHHAIPALCLTDAASRSLYV
jgi:hypothetical protein